MKIDKITITIFICFLTAILFIINGINKKDAIYFILGLCWVIIGIEYLQKKRKLKKDEK